MHSVENDSQRNVPRSRFSGSVEAVEATMAASEPSVSTQPRPKLEMDEALVLVIFVARRPRFPELKH